MERTQVTDEWLYRYMPIVDESIVKELEETTDYEYQFSPRFQRKMKKLMRRETHMPKMALMKRHKWAAGFLMGIIGSICVLSVTASAHRMRLFDTVKVFLENMAVFSYATEEEQEEFCCTEPEYIPEGYKETDRLSTDFLSSILYENSEGETILLEQTLIQNEDRMIVDTEYDFQAVVDINGSRAVIYLYAGGFKGVYYECGAYVYELTADNLSQEEVCKILESLK